MTKCVTEPFVTYIHLDMLTAFHVPKHSLQIAVLTREMFDVDFQFDHVPFFMQVSQRPNGQ